MRLPTPYKIKLIEEEFEGIKKKSIGKAAVEICKIYFRRKYEEIKFKRCTNGADLEIITGKKKFQIEIKGTKHNEIVWANLAVVSRKSYNLLKKGLKLYVTVRVRTKEPKIYILTYGKDFVMTREERWGIHPSKK